ncbi:MAG TPA: ORF6N domain-containing protein [Bryobacteraceae bacterium]|nr:ORF6N domain-containing protein [Bryobacteraceae bacterium]
MDIEQALTITTSALVPPERIERRIYLIRGQKVMLDADLAELYGVPTKSLNLAVRRNSSRFPPDFMFQLTKEEDKGLRFQNETSKSGGEGRGGRRYLPYAFTEHGIAMLSSVLRSERAVQMNILIVRAFIRLRDMLLTNKDLADRIEALEADQQNHASVITLLAEEIQDLKQFPEPTKRNFGFKAPTTH